MKEWLLALSVGLGALLFSLSTAAALPYAEGSDSLFEDYTHVDLGAALLRQTQICVIKGSCQLSKVIQDYFLLG
jgi:hypothetical protein